MNYSTALTAINLRSITVNEKSKLQENIATILYEKV